MAKYRYSRGLGRIQNILNQEMSTEDRKWIPSESSMTYSNGFAMRIGSIFVDIRESTKLFKNSNQDMVTRIVRSYISELIEVLDRDNVFEVGIRGDCVYAIYSTPYQKDIENMMDAAVEANTLIKLLNKYYASMHFPQLKVGIGVSISDALVIKAGRKGHGVNDTVWLGAAVSEASHLSNMGSKHNYNILYGPIVVSKSVYEGISKNYYNSYLPNSFHKCPEGYYLGIVDKQFNDWIDRQNL